MLSTNENKADIFIEKMVYFFKLEEKKDLVNDLIIILKSRKYERDLKEMIYFFENLNLQNNKKDDWNYKLSSKYKKLSEMELKDLKKNLEELKKWNI